jgi:hypothetical protein
VGLAAVSADLALVEAVRRHGSREVVETPELGAMAGKARRRAEHGLLASRHEPG